MDVNKLVSEIAELREQYRLAVEDKNNILALVIESELNKMYIAYGKFMVDEIIE